MKRKLPWLAAVFLAAGLLLIACPIQHDPYAVPHLPPGAEEIERIGTFTGLGRGQALGFFGLRDTISSFVVVYLTFDDGYITDVYIESYDETAGYTDLPIAAWENAIRIGNILPPVLPPGPRPDAFSGGTITINQLRVAFLLAMANAREQWEAQ